LAGRLRRQGGRELLARALRTSGPAPLGRAPADEDAVAAFVVRGVFAAGGVRLPTILAGADTDLILDFRPLREADDPGPSVGP
jgi:hypothetical protein